MSWTPEMDVAFTIALPEVKGKWFAVAGTDTSNGTWLSPGPKFKELAQSIMNWSSRTAEVLATELLCVIPPTKSCPIAVVKATDSISQSAQALEQLIKEM